MDTGPLKEQPVHLITEPSSSPRVCLYWARASSCIPGWSRTCYVAQSGHNPFDLASWGLGYRNKLWYQLWVPPSFFLRFIHLCTPCVPRRQWTPMWVLRIKPTSFAITSVLNHWDNTLALRVLLLTHSSGTKQIGAFMLPYRVRGSYLPQW